MDTDEFDADQAEADLDQWAESLGFDVSQLDAEGRKRAIQQMRLVGAKRQRLG